MMNWGRHRSDYALKEQFNHLPGGTEGNTMKNPKTGGLRTYMNTGVPNIKQECQPLKDDVWYCIMKVSFH